VRLGAEDDNPTEWFVLKNGFDRVKVLSKLNNVSIKRGDRGGRSIKFRVGDHLQGTCDLTNHEHSMHTPRASSSMEPIIGERYNSSRTPNAIDVNGEFRLAWQWVEGWRARLRKAGDFVVNARYM